MTITFKDEAEFRDALVAALTYYRFNVSRHEDKVSNFMPDLSFAYAGFDGWAEVKWLPSDPVSMDAVSHWTKGQEDWLRRRGYAGCGLCFLIVGTPRRVICWRWDRLEQVRANRFDDSIMESWLIAPTLSEFAGALEDRLARVSQRRRP